LIGVGAGVLFLLLLIGLFIVLFVLVKRRKKNSRKRVATLTIQNRKKIFFFQVEIFSRQPPKFWMKIILKQIMGASLLL
jgi:hypothetical protein